MDLNAGFLRLLTVIKQGAQTHTNPHVANLSIKATHSPLLGAKNSSASVACTYRSFESTCRNPKTPKANEWEELHSNTAKSQAIERGQVKK